MKVVISSGHGIKVRGAAGPPPWGLDEVDEAIRVMNRTAEYLRSAGVDVKTYTDSVSTSQNENLNRIVDFHNAQSRDLDVSIHFNAYEITETKKMGTECLYVTQEELSAEVAATIAAATNLPNRGAKYRGDLFFLNNTEKPAILVETVFCDAKPDCDAYREDFEDVCRGLAEAIYGEPIAPPEPEPIPPEPEPVPPTEVARVDITTKGAVQVYVNGELVTAAVLWRENITTTVFAGSGDPQDSAYGTGRIDPTVPAASLPYKWRDRPPPDIIVKGPGGELRVPLVDVGPWNTDDPNYVLEGYRPLVEQQYDDKIAAQNGRVPSNDAALDLTPAAAQAVGIEGKGKAKWRFA